MRTNQKVIGGSVLSVLAAVGVGGAIDSAHGRVESPTARSAGHAPSRSTIAQPATGAGATPDAACDLNATAQPDAVDPRVSASWSKNKVSGPMPAGTQPLSRSAALADALQFAGWFSSAAVPPHAEAQVPYSQASEWLQNPAGDQRVAPTRCVWVVTVQMPYVVQRRPANTKPGRGLPGVTVVVDSGSGEFLDLMAGEGAPNLVTGANLTSQTSN